MRQVKFRSGRIAVPVVLAAATVVNATAVQAQENYPDHPIRLIVPFPPGGQTDNVARQLGAKIAPLLRQQLIVENRSGAAGTIGSAEAARAKPDGYTLLIATTSTHAINPMAMPNVPYDAVKDFAPVTVVGTGPIAVSVHPVVPARTLQQLVADVKARPGQYSYGSSGVASINHLAGELLKTRAGNLQILHVPYKGAGASVQDLIGGQIEIVCSTLSAALPHHRQGRVRTLAVMKDQRSIGAPDIPTTAEAGVSGVVAYTYNIILTPAGTPRAIVDQLNAAIAKVMADSAFVETLVRLGVDPITDSNPDKAASMIVSELGKWRPIIQALQLGVDTPVRSASPRR
jgi:tripartite-type tricarboxylate transporter receptor subunit TctC